MVPRHVRRNPGFKSVQNYHTASGPIAALHFPVPSLLFFFFLCWPARSATAQPGNRQTLRQLLDFSQANNRSIQKERIATQIAEEEVTEKKQLRIPEVDFHGAYARITDLIEYRHGLGDKVTTHTIPVIADVTAAAKLAIYAGGRVKYSIMKAKQEEAIAGLQLQAKTHDVSLEVIGAFLGIYKLMELQRLLAENITEEEDRLREVKAFKVHGTVTQNEVLREELQLSDMQLALLTNGRNIDIAAQELKTILQWPEGQALNIDTTGLLSQPVRLLGYETYLMASSQKEQVRIQQGILQQTEIDRRIQKSSYYPVVNLFGSYGFNYPNYMFFPPDPYLYTLGRVGVEATFSISNIYKNRVRMQTAQKRVQQQQLQTQIVIDAVGDQIFRYYTQLADIIDRIQVNEKALSLANENYRIVRVKYLNQLALITEMLDADNALLQARFNAVSTRIDAVMKLRELEYAAGLYGPSQLN